MRALCAPDAPSCSLFRYTFLVICIKDVCMNVCICFSMTFENIFVYVQSFIGRCGVVDLCLTAAGGFARLLSNRFHHTYIHTYLYFIVIPLIALWTVSRAKWMLPPTQRSGISASITVWIYMYVCMCISIMLPRSNFKCMYVCMQ